MTTGHDVAWVCEVARRKAARREAQHQNPEDESSVAFSVLRTELWQEFIAAIGAYNREVGREALIIALQADGRIGISKDSYPSGYLDIQPDRQTGRVVVTYQMQAGANTPVERRVTESGVVVRGGVARIFRGGRELSVPEEVRRVLLPFLEET